MSAVVRSRSWERRRSQERVTGWRRLRQCRIEYPVIYEQSGEIEAPARAPWIAAAELPPFIVCITAEGGSCAAAIQGLRLGIA
jgi:hypothetical protein